MHARPPQPARPALPAIPALVALLAAGLAGCANRPPEDPKDYVTVVKLARAAKDEELKTSSKSPVPANRRAELLPLGYFPIDPDYKTAATLMPSSDSTVIPFATSTGVVRQMRRVGSLEFTLKDHPLKLTAFVEVGAPNIDHLFVPFTDLTTGTETYPGGRYLDLDRNETGIYEIDFNRAYFPYCYYSPTYECPYPPRENRLPMPVRAGERFKLQS